MRNMAEAAFAVSVASKDRKQDVLERAAKTLKVSPNKLKNFRRNLFAKDDRIKSPQARLTLRMEKEFRDLTHHLPGDDIEFLLSKLGPVPKEHRDV